MKMPFLYPGQGSQAVGMGVALADAYPEALAVFDCASEIVGYDMYRLCADGPIEKLSQTKYTQPALYTVEAAITDVLKINGVKPSMAAGHSLGEFAAWYAADVYSFEEGLTLVAERGRIMEEADPEGKGSMAAVIGLDAECVEAVCREIEGTLVVANYNSPLQIVISGEKHAISAAEILLKEKGAKRVMPLKVSGAFHSPLMEKAREEFADLLEDVVMIDAVFPVYSNVTASPVKDANTIRGLIIDQLTSPVRWTSIIRKMSDQKVTEALEIGPGSVISGLVKRIDEAIFVKAVSDPTGIQEIING